MKLTSCPKVAYGRSVEPERTIERLESILGARYRYEMVEQRVSDYMYWTALFVDELEFRSMGKGITPVLSRAGALAEAAEWLTARETADLPGFVIAHQKDLANPLPIEELLAHVVTASQEVVEKVKASQCAHYWVDGESLITGKVLKVPIEYVRRIAGPNGVASGNRIEEAILHALNEIFERRAHITTLRRRMVVPTISQDSIRNPVIRSQIEFVKSRGIEVTIKDVSFGGALPCIGVYFRDPNIPEDYQFHHFFKVGASFDREEALTRCFTEYAQGRRLDEFIEAKPEEQARVLRDDFRNLRCMDESCDNFLSAFMFGMVPLRRADFLMDGEVVDFDAGQPTGDCLEDIEMALQIFRALGRDVIVVDLTGVDTGFPVVQVVAPGYSDVLPYHPANSSILFRRLERPEVLRSYDKRQMVEDA